MSEETEQTPVPEEQQPLAPRPLPKPVLPKKPPVNPFGGKNNHFNSSKAGNPNNRGKSFKGGGVKKGK